MILVVDIGNTHTVIGAYKGEKLKFVTRISTNARKTAEEYATKLKAVLDLHKVEDKEIVGGIISSVVPPLNGIFKEAVKLVYGFEPMIVGPGIKTGLNLIVDNPASVGADLICACVGAKEKYACPMVIVDMGTATKLIILDEKGAFIGVTIAPGVELALKALSGGTAQLPQIDLDIKPVLMGKNTIECMRSGVIFGNASMVDGMIERFTEELGGNLNIIATGGLSKVIIPYCKHKIEIDENIVLDGLKIIYEKNKKG